MFKSEEDTINISKREYNQLVSIKRLFEGQKEISQWKAFEANGIEDLRNQLMQ